MTTIDNGSSTRREILRSIRINGGRTAQQLAAELKITSMGVRRHLMTLERDGLLRAQTQRQPAGRPTFVYQLTEEGYDTFPKSYHLLATQLLDAARARAGKANVEDLFAGRMDQLVAQFEPRMRNKDLAGRVAELAKIQDENGYMAIWEKVDGGFLLREQNCAIFRVACRFQEACVYEIELFRRLLGTDMTRVQHQVKGDLSCTYFISDKSSSARRTPSRAHPVRGSNSKRKTPML